MIEQLMVFIYAWFISNLFMAIITDKIEGVVLLVSFLIGLLLIFILNF